MDMTTTTEKVAFSFRRKSETGASLVEYALLIMLITLVAIVAVRFFGGAVSTSFSTSTSSMFSGS